MPEKNFIRREMRSTMIKLFVLRRIGRSEMNSYTLMKEITENRRASGFFYNESSIKNEIYNTINSLQKSGYLKSSQKIENGRLKNYYALTANGRELLKSARSIFEKNIKEMGSLLNQ